MFVTAGVSTFMKRNVQVYTAMFTRTDGKTQRRKTARIFDALLLFLSPVKHGR